MSVRLSCDLCGRPLASNSLIKGLPGQGAAMVAATGTHDDHRAVDAPARHFCADRSDDPDSCLRKAMDLFDMAIEAHCAELGLEWQLVPTADQEG